MSDEKSDLAVMDAEEYKQKRRLKALLDAKDKVESKADEAQELYVVGEVDRQLRNVIVLEAVQQFIREGWNLVKEYWKNNRNDPAATEYMEGRTLGSVEIAGEEVAQFVGLYDLLWAESVYSRDVVRTREFPHGADATISETVEKAVPRDVAWRGYLLMSEFLANEHGLKMMSEERSDVSSFGFQSVSLDEVDIELLNDRFEDADLRALKKNGGSDE